MEEGEWREKEKKMHHPRFGEDFCEPDVSLNGWVSYTHSASENRMTPVCLCVGRDS